MVDAAQILNYLSSNKLRLKREYHLTKIGIFGSIARGEQTPKSDIDLIVEFEENTADLFTIEEKIKQEIEERFHLPVGICLEKQIKPVFRGQILSEAIFI